MLLFCLIVLATQAVQGQPTFPFPQGRYIGGLLARYLRVDVNFVTAFEIPRVRLSISCGSSRDSWDGWFDIDRGMPGNLFKLKDYQTGDKYAELLAFYDAHCGRAPGKKGDLALFTKDLHLGQYATRLGNDRIFLYPA
ncbi:hypothetical protein FOZ61_010344 [Perkinsus olseni]|uniref:Uncharacterized protein n=1 Tax=Perkinsus olseni TaxID=32597 RepID=A0A7J6M433_PEROL|nr:hypothetical protein FOZ61_010344 [Perkinsus olseni]KAF4672226.1 hypothetical protein FOL46_009302 [Perkinsus olseni]